MIKIAENGKRFFVSPKRPDHLRVQAASYRMGTVFLCPGQSGWVLKLTTYTYLVTRLILLVPIHAFMAWTGTSSPSFGSVSGVIITKLWGASWFPLGPAGKCRENFRGSAVTASFHIPPVNHPLLPYHSALHSRTYVHRRKIDQKWIHKVCINTNKNSGDLIILILYNAAFEPVTVISV